MYPIAFRPVYFQLLWFRIMSTLLNISPVFPVNDIDMEIEFFEKLGFKNVYDSLSYSELLDYAVMHREGQSIHLQLFGDEPFPGQQIKIWTKNILAIEKELNERGIKYNRNFDTPWNTNELGLYSPSKHAIFFVQERS